MNEKKKGERGLGVPEKRGSAIQECSWDSGLEEENFQAVFFECLGFKIVWFESSFLVSHKNIGNSNYFSLGEKQSFSS